MAKNGLAQAEQVRDKAIVAEMQRSERSAVQAGQDRYYQPHGKPPGQDVEINIER